LNLHTDSKAPIPPLELGWGTFTEIGVPSGGLINDLTSSPIHTFFSVFNVQCIRLLRILHFDRFARRRKSVGLESCRTKSLPLSTENLQFRPDGFQHGFFFGSRTLPPCLR